MITDGLRRLLPDWDSCALCERAFYPGGPHEGLPSGRSGRLDITNIDPLQYDLIFERFNPGRVSCPILTSTFVYVAGVM